MSARRKMPSGWDKCCARCGGTIAKVAGLPTCESCGPMSMTGPALDDPWRGHMDEAPREYLARGGTRAVAVRYDED